MSHRRAPGLDTELVNVAGNHDVIYLAPFNLLELWAARARPRYTRRSIGATTTLSCSTRASGRIST
jgi:hypothetical protein